MVVYSSCSSGPSFIFYSFRTWLVTQSFLLELSLNDIIRFIGPNSLFILYVLCFFSNSVGSFCFVLICFFQLYVKKQMGTTKP